MSDLSIRQKILLLVFQNLRNSKKLDPIQIQKTIFLIEKECIENKSLTKISAIQKTWIYLTKIQHIPSIDNKSWSCISISAKNINTA